jgi:hypothetical protein
MQRRRVPPAWLMVVQMAKGQLGGHGVSDLLSTARGWWRRSRSRAEGGQRQKESGGTRETETRETERCYGQRLDKYAILHSQ